MKSPLQSLKTSSLFNMGGAAKRRKKKKEAAAKLKNCNAGVEPATAETLPETAPPSPHTGESIGKWALEAAKTPTGASVKVPSVEVAPVEVPPVEVPPVEVPPVEVAPVEVPPVEVPPVEVPPVEVPPVEVPPVDTAVVDAAVVEVAPVEVAPVEVLPVDVPPVEVAPVEVPPVEVPPVDTAVVEVPSVEAALVEVPPVEVPTLSVEATLVEVPPVEAPSVEVPTLPVEVPPLDVPTLPAEPQPAPRRVIETIAFQATPSPSNDAANAPNSSESPENMLRHVSEPIDDDLVFEVILEDGAYPENSVRSEKGTVDSLNESCVDVIPLSQCLYGGVKNIWWVGTHIPVVNLWMGLTHHVAEKVVGLVGQELNAVDHVIETKLAELDFQVSRILGR